VTPRWGLEPTVFHSGVRRETELPIDDLLIFTSADGAVYLRAKLGISLSRDVDSPFGAAIRQFVRHLLFLRLHKPGKHPWQRPLDQVCDRLVPIIDGRAPQ
jgi:hypothetical protein